jgi:GWxTD domain-containing protein
MTLIDGWVQTPLAEAVGWTLLHLLWEGAIISAALAAGLWAMRSARARYAAGCVAMLLMIGAFTLTLLRAMAEGAHSLQIVRPPAFPPWNVPGRLDVPDPSNTGLAAIVPWLALFWITGVCIFYLRHTVGWISVCRLRRRGVCCVSQLWQKKLSSLTVQLHLSRPVRLLESCFVDAPMVFGHFRPLILMPIGLLAGLPAGQIEAILLHELAHIRRYDYLVNVLQGLVEGLLFYHPAVWWISRVIRAERENCCDDVVVAMSGNAREYAAALAALEQNRWSGRDPAVAATGGSLVKRIRRLLYPKGAHGGWTPLLATVVLIVIAAVALTAWQAAPPAPQRAEASPYVRWLNEDVVYIITDEERAAFQRLVTDEEREKFIEQFWQRREPVPAKNEFKAEHYRRIMYANQRFRTASGRPGWQTDRGHMYIVYGPPDEIEVHPRRVAQTPSSVEVWMYHHVEGIGDNRTVTFIDRTGTGDYRLAPGNAP